MSTSSTCKPVSRSSISQASQFVNESIESICRYWLAGLSHYCPQVAPTLETRDVDVDKAKTKSKAKGAKAKDGFLGPAAWHRTDSKL